MGNNVKREGRVRRRFQSISDERLKLAFIDHVLIVVQTGALNVKCPVCDTAELIHVTRDLPYTYKGRTTVISAVTAEFCPACGESITDIAEAERVMREMQAFNKQVMRMDLS